MRSVFVRVPNEPWGDRCEVWLCPHCSVKFTLVLKYSDGRPAWLDGIKGHLSTHFTIEQLEALRP